LTSSVEEALKEAFDVANTKYNPLTQVRENADGIPQFFNNGGKGTSSNGQCNSIINLLVVLDVDVVIDDNDIL
jgi:hypothetical protein